MWYPACQGLFVCVGNGQCSMVQMYSHLKKKLGLFSSTQYQYCFEYY